MANNSWVEKKEMFYMDKKYSNNKSSLEVKYISIPIQDDPKNGYGDIQLKLTFQDSTGSHCIVLNLAQVNSLFYEALEDPTRAGDIFFSTSVRSHKYNHINGNSIEFIYKKDENEECIVQVEYADKFKIVLPFNSWYRAFYGIIKGFIDNFSILNHIFVIPEILQHQSRSSSSHSKGSKYVKKTEKGY